MRVTAPLAVLAAQALTAHAQSFNSSAIYPLSSNTQFAFTLEVALSQANGGGANTGEILRAASQIVPGDFESFYSAFRYLADAIHAQGSATRSPSARRDAYFRSATYYRFADFYLHGNASDPRIDELWDLQTADFDEAIALLPVPGERVTVKSAEGFDVPMIFYSPGGDSGTAVPTKRRSSKNNNSTCKAPTPRRPTILAGSGYDGAQEDLYHGLARYANDRGWNLVTYEGPGQPTVRRRQGLGFRPDWWSVVTPAVDYLLSRDDVDASRLALLGQSFGGTLAPLAASRERRFAAVLAVDGLYSMQDMVRANLPAELMAVFDAGEKEVFDQVLDSVRKNETADTTFRWLVDQSLWSFDTDSPFEWFTRLGEFTLDGVIGNISCPVFVGSGEDDLSTAGQPEKVAALLGDKGHYHLFKTDLGAGEHCQIGAEAQLALVAFDWLEGVFEGVGQTGKNSTAR